MPIPALIPVIGLISTVFRGWMGAKKVKAEGKAKIAQAKVEAKVRRIKGKHELDLAAMNSMANSWKDEYLTILMSVPIALCFVPGFSQYAQQGFAILETLPEWYRYVFIGIVMSTFGLRSWMKHLQGKK